MSSEKQSAPLPCGCRSVINIIVGRKTQNIHPAYLQKKKSAAFAAQNFRAADGRRQPGNSSKIYNQNGKLPLLIPAGFYVDSIFILQEKDYF
ncbi:MAG: hypothetical protein GX057_00985 [Clostridiales bacterium]|nr:hypothetical protein [Clostridiales bacterium]